MQTAHKDRTRRRQTPASARSWGKTGGDSQGRAHLLGLRRSNLLLLVGAAAAIIAGYVLLDRGSITVAPILLVVGYAVLIPAGLLVGSRQKDS